MECQDTVLHCIGIQMVDDSIIRYVQAVILLCILRACNTKGDGILWACRCIAQIGRYTSRVWTPGRCQCVTQPLPPVTKIYSWVPCPQIDSYMLLISLVTSSWSIVCQGRAVGDFSKVLQNHSSLFVAFYFSSFSWVPPCRPGFCGRPHKPSVIVGFS